MKRIIISLFIILLVSLPEVYGQEIISLLDGRVTFEKLEHSDVIYSNSWKGSRIGKIRIITGVRSETFFGRAEWDAFSPELARILEQNNRIITGQELFDLLKTNQPFALSPDREGIFLEQSYSTIMKNNEIVGETYAGISPIKYSWPCGFSFKINIVVGNSIINISASMVDTYRTIPNEKPEYFIKKDEKFYWKSEEARIEFYEKMNSDIETMPEQIQTLYETYKLILETLTIE